MIFEFLCPYCGHANRKSLDLKEHKADTLAYCDIEDGGCDKQIVITYWVEQKTQVRKIAEERT